MDVFQVLFFRPRGVCRRAQDAPFLGQAEDGGASRAGTSLELSDKISVFAVYFSRRRASPDVTRHAERGVLCLVRRSLSSALPGYIADFLRSFCGAWFLSFDNRPPARTRCLQTGRLQQF